MQVGKGKTQEATVEIGSGQREKFEYIGKLCADQHSKIKLVQFSPAECHVEACFALTASNSVIAW